MGDVFRLREIHDGIYMLTFEVQYDLNMHFLRYQEFYESPSDRFRGKAFRIFDYMRWYSLEQATHDGSFTYTDDWAGFNIPNTVFEDVYRLGIPDENKYDVTMRAVYETIRQCEGDDGKWYLVGCIESSPAIEHELAHGLWYVDDRYNLEMRRIIAALEADHADVYNALHDALVSEGYAEHVVSDEVQAYMSTGMAGTLIENLTNAGYDEAMIEKFREPFQNVFTKYMENADLPWVVDSEQP